MLNKTVMIIEDNILHMKLFNDILESQGYTTLRASDGETALELARTNSPDLILLDIQLPLISGFAVIKQLKSELGLKDIPVVAITAMDERMGGDRYLREGFDGYLSKPITVPNMLQTIAGFISPKPIMVH
ncbi:MAG: response regulator [Rhodospirillales bacterium]|nr:response regulator [Rhodospirillales bacterium]